MKKIFILIIALILVLITGFVYFKYIKKKEVIQINDGITTIDLNNDGTEDLIVKTFHQTESASSDKFVYMFSIFDSETKKYKNIQLNSEDIVVEMLGNEEDLTLDCHKSVIGLSKNYKKEIILTIVSLELNDLFNPSPSNATISKYKIDNSSGIYEWKLINKEKKNGKYCNLKELL